MALVAICEASTSSSNCLLGSGRMSTGALVMRFLSSLTAAMQSGVHSNGMSFPKRRVIGAVMEENLAINMRWYPKTPMNERAPLRVVMFSGQSAIPAILAGSTVALSLVRRTPKKSMVGFMKIDLLSLRCSPFLARRSKAKWRISMCSLISLSFVPSPQSSI